MVFHYNNRNSRTKTQPFAHYLCSHLKPENGIKDNLYGACRMSYKYAYFNMDAVSVPLAYPTILKDIS